VRPFDNAPIVIGDAAARLERLTPPLLEVHVTL